MQAGEAQLVSFNQGDKEVRNEAFVSSNERPPITMLLAFLTGIRDSSMVPARPEGGEHSAPSACTVLTRDFEDAFGSSATTEGLLLRRRYVLPPHSHFFPIFGVTCPYQAKNFRCSRKKVKAPKKSCPVVERE
jgi:hypothetical protein